MKRTEDITKTTKTPDLSSGLIGEARAKAEKYLDDNIKKPTTIPDLARAIDCPKHQARNIIMRLMRAVPPKVREIGRNEKNQPLFVWHTSSIKSTPSRKIEKPSDVAPTRTWVNGAMPAADSSFWKSLYGTTPIR